MRLFKNNEINIYNIYMRLFKNDEINIIKMIY